MLVKPAPGRAVRDPRSRKVLPATGWDVPETSFWLRRVRDKDVLVEPKTAPASAPVASAVAAEPSGVSEVATASPTLPAAAETHSQVGEH